MNKTLYRKYRHIKDRCYNLNSKSYKRYGGRGIKMCQEWFDSYQLFEDWCLTHGFEENLAIDRINNDDDYSPDNCRFVTLKENNQNRRTTVWYTINGVTKNLQQWCDYYNIKRGTVYTRLEHGWDIEQALTTPVKKRIRDKTSLIGKKFGRLTVLEYAYDESKKSANKSRWVCNCDCGNTIIVAGDKLKSGHTKSCGCIQKEKARARMITDNPMKAEEQRRRMVEHNPMRKKGK